MPRDYKHVARPRPSRSTRAPGGRSAPRKRRGWAWLLGGVAVGVLAVSGYHQWERSHSGLRSAAKTAPPAPAKKAQEPPQPHYEFYSLLPKMEVVVPEAELQRAPPKPAPTAKPAAPEAASAPKVGEAHYLLQAGSYATHGEADKVKARLAFLGIEARIQPISAGGEGRVYRVRIGPFRDLERVNQVRSQLRQHAIDAIVLKVSG
jgi:cell division protein FtsN